MKSIDRLGWADGICFTSYGLQIGIRANTPEVLQRVVDRLPPGWTPAGSPEVRRLYSLIDGGSATSSRVRRFNILYAGPLRIARSLDLEHVVDMVENDVQLYVAERAQRRVFVHAGVVGWKGKAILLPGRSFSGKSTLVKALVEAGATYYSDEFAVLGESGRVSAFPRPICIRSGSNGRSERHVPEALGAHTGSKSLPVGLVCVTSYREGARFRPREISAGRAVLELLDNTVPARRRPKASMTTLRRALGEARALKGVRGDAAETAEALLARLG